MPRVSSRLVCVRETAQIGLGLFALKTIQKGETIFVVKGKKIFWEVKDEETSLHGPNWLGFSSSVWIIPEAHSPWTYLNHSCEPTAGIKGAVTVVALRTIKQGEEVTIDYSTTEEDTRWHLRCLCHSKQCRKMIRAIQFLPYNIYTSYLPHIPDYFQEVYIRERKRGKRYLAVC